jgi:hypothetical protein
MAVQASQNPLFDRPFSRETMVNNPVERMQSAGLLDPSRFNISHSYSMSYISSGFQSDLLGMYLNHIRYQFSVPLSLQVDWGYVIRPLDANNPDPNVKAGNFALPRIALQYQPTKNMFISFEYLDLSSLRSQRFNQGSFSPFFLDPVPSH